MRVLGAIFSRMVYSPGLTGSPCNMTLAVQERLARKFRSQESGGEGGIRFASRPIQSATYRLHVPKIAEFATAARVPCTISHYGLVPDRKR